MEELWNQSFPAKSLNDWIQKAEQSLKGKSVGSLQSTTYENIILKPLYTRDDEHAVPEYPGSADFRRGIDPLGYLKNDWKNAQRLAVDKPEELVVKLKDAALNGQTALSFEVSKETVRAQFGDLINQYPFAVNSKWLQDELLQNLAEQAGSKEQVSGFIASDPIALFIEEGIFSEELIKKWIMDIKRANKEFPHLRTVLIDTTPYHNGGANAVQELGIAASTGVYYLQQFIDNKIDLNDALGKMIFQFSIGSNFFTELAKLRAARVVWNRITELYGASNNSRGMQISAATSSFTKTLYDPHVNLLRAGNEAFAAVLGGVQYLHIDAFNMVSGTNAFTERIARNIQLILKEEAHLKKVIDPAGGSWYIESITNQLAEKAWEFFQQIEGAGGIIEAIRSNRLQQEIQAVYEKRNKDIQTRKQSMVGINVYAKLDEEVPEIKQREKFNPVSGIPVQPILNHRLSEPYEELRKRAKEIELQTGKAPTVGMLCLGELKQYKARLDFMKGFLAAGGIDAVASEPVFLLENGKQFVVNTQTKFICLCGINEKYETIGHDFLSRLTAEFPDRTFLMAGVPESQAQWVDEGIKQFIHIKSNCYEVNSALLADMEVSAVEEAKA